MPMWIPSCYDNFMDKTPHKKVVEAITLTKAQMHEAARSRVAEIAKEFTEGFKFLENYPRSVTFFGSSQTKEGEAYYESARRLSSRIVKELGYAVISGGGPGIMEAADRGAFEANGNSIGLLIKLPHSQPINSYIKKSISFYYFFARKVCLAYGAEVFLFFPGGYGTLDEFFEIITLIQTKKMPPAPIICVGSPYWSKMKDLIEKELLARDMIDPEDMKLFTVTDNHDEIMKIIKNASVRESIPLTEMDQRLTEEALRL